MQTPMKCSIMLYFIWFFTVCQSTHTEFPVQKGVKININECIMKRSKCDSSLLLVCVFFIVKNHCTSVESDSVDTGTGIHTATE